MSATGPIKVKIGTPVIGADGKRIGDIDGVVLNPENNRVRQVLMRKGSRRHSDQSFGVQSVTRIDEEGLHVSFTREEADMMDHQMSSDYLAPAQGAFVGTGVYMAMPTAREQGVMTEMGADREEFDDHLGLQQRLLEFRRGAKVIDKDGEELGEVADLAVVTGGKISAFRVDAGRFRRHTERWVSIELVAQADEEQVTLSVTGAQLDEQPQTQPAPNVDEGFLLDRDDS